MPTLTLQVPDRETQTRANLDRWAELVDDPELARLPYRIETDRFGHLIMSPPPAPHHGNRQSEMAHLLRQHRPEGVVFTECPISTSNGVRVADVAWASRDAVARLSRAVCFTDAPEICVEVLSPRNSAAEMREKMTLYFEAGALEVWLCEESGAMRFHLENGPAAASTLCPDFPGAIPVL